MISLRVLSFLQLRRSAPSHHSPAHSKWFVEVHVVGLFLCQIHPRCLVKSLPWIATFFVLNSTCFMINHLILCSSLRTLLKRFSLMNFRRTESPHLTRNIVFAQLIIRMIRFFYLKCNSHSHAGLSPIKNPLTLVLSSIRNSNGQYIPVYAVNRKCHDFNLYLTNIHTYCTHSFVSNTLIHSTPRNIATWIHKIYIRNGFLSILCQGMRKWMAMLTFGKNSRKCTRFYTILFDKLMKRFQKDLIMRIYISINWKYFNGYANWNGSQDQLEVRVAKIHSKCLNTLCYSCTCSWLHSIWTRILGLPAFLFETKSFWDQHSLLPCEKSINPFIYLLKFAYYSSVNP